MKMKRILTEWRKFVNEGVSNLDIAMKKIADINKSFSTSDREAQKQIASIYLPWALRGSEPKGSKEFYEGRITDTDLISMLQDLRVAVDDLEESGEQTVKTKYFTVEAVGEHTEKEITPKIRIRSRATNVAEVVLDDADEVFERIDKAIQMISQFDFDFSKLSTEYMPSSGRTSFPGRGGDKGTGGIQTPPDMTPEELSEFENMMALYSQTHQVLASNRNKKKDKKYFDMLKRVYEQQKQFYQYMYELWSSKVGEENEMTVMYKTAALGDDYDERLSALVKSPEMLAQFEKERMEDPSLRGDDFQIAMTTSDKAEADRIMRSLQKAGDKRWREIRMRMRSM